ncbi:DUF1648 domain-containing protein [Streptococcus massiliensis]|uniref:Integral membrane protein n=1 Tax=Streptococcus massiliensis TaxID=313439 RepID=A0A380L0E9_9STRE|nr:DUF1648 domain-containing protein [Streptococcus massiliensis]SUN76824.1 integral membrane protein [Streptococcus massiliensis]
MKLKNNMKELILSVLVIWLPVLYGLYIYKELPQELAVHFSFTGQADGLMNKELFLWGFPIVISLFQLFIYWTTVIQIITNKIFKHFIRWIIPIVALVLQTGILFRALNSEFNIRKMVLVLVGVVFIGLGNYIPKKVIVDQHRKSTSRKLAYSLIVAGSLSLLCALFLG